MASLISQILVAFLTLRLKVVFSQDYSYLGCFYDSNRREILPDLIYCNRSTYPYLSCRNVCGPRTQYCQSDGMTTELCRDICADQNMRFFGLQAGTQCLCGGFFAPYDSRGQPAGQNGTCNRPCSGNSSQMCGADFQASVYQINEPGSDCFNPGYVLNGDQSQQDNTFYNADDFIDYGPVCPPPSIKNGTASITCTTSGNWTDPPPTCTIRCATPTAPPYSHFSPGQTLHDSYAVDDEVLYDCDNDPTRTNLMLTCGYYGDWMNTLMDCAEPTTRVTTTTQPTTTPQLTTLPSPTASTTSTAGGGVSGSTFSTVITGPSTTESTAVTMSTQSSTPSPSTDGSISPSSSITGNPSSSSSSGPLSSTGHGATSPEATATMTSTPVREGTSTPSATDGGAGTTPDSGRNTSNDMDWIPIIIGAAAGVLLLILVIIVVSVCCSRKRKQKKKNIPFDPALGASFGNPAFENDDEAEQSRRGFVQENDYGDRQTYDIGVSDYAMAVDETDRVPPDGKDSPAGVGNGVEEGMYAVVNKNRQDAAGS